MENAQLPSAVLFLDVDGVLNRNWWEATGADAHDEGIDAQLTANLSTFCNRLTQRGQCVPVVVVSSTWRLNTQLTSQLVAALQEHRIELYRDPTDSDWCTPDLGDSRSSAGRVAEVKAWVQAHPEHTIWLALDDLLLRATDGMPLDHFLHTASNELSIGFTTDKIDVALTMIEAQLQRFKEKVNTWHPDETSTGQFTQAEWDILMASQHFYERRQLLRKVPIAGAALTAIIEKAQVYLRHKRGSVPPSEGGCANCTCTIL